MDPRFLIEGHWYKTTLPLLNVRRTAECQPIFDSLQFISEEYGAPFGVRYRFIAQLAIGKRSFALTAEEVELLYPHEQRNGLIDHLKRKEMERRQ